MNGLDFFFPAPATTAATATVNATISAGADNNEEDDDWGEFASSSDAISRTESLPPDPIGFLADRNGTDSSELAQPDSAPSRIESEKKSQAQWFKPQGPVPLLVFGEAEEEEEAEGDGSGAAVPSLKFSFNSFSSKHNNGNGSVNKVVNTNPGIGINDLIANMYRQNGQSKPKNGLNSESGNSLCHLDTYGKNSNPSLNPDGNLSSSTSAGVNVKMDGLNLELNKTDLSVKVLNSVTSLDSFSWNPLNLDTERFEPKSNVINSSTSGMMLDPNGSSSGFWDQNDAIDDDDGWEFKTAESKLQTGDGDFKSDENKAESGPVVASNTSNLSWNIWSPATNRIGPIVDNVKTEVDNSVSHLRNGDDDSWNDGWEFEAAEPGEPKNDITSKVEGKETKDVEGAGFAFAFDNGVHQNDDLFAASFQQSSGWGFGSDFNRTSKTETLSVYHSNAQSQQYERGNGLSFFQSYENMSSEETSWAFKQSSSETGAKNEENAVITDIPPGVIQTLASDGVIQKKEPQFEKPKGPLSLSIFGDGDLENSDPVVHEDISTSIHASFLRDKTKTPGPSMSISDLISSLYSQVEEKTSVNLTQKSDENEFVSANTVTDSSSLNGEDDFEDDSWEFQGPTQSTTDSGRAIGDDVDDDSWKFQGPTQPVTNSNSTKEGYSSWESKGGSMGNEAESQIPVPAVVGEQNEKAVTKLGPKDYEDFYDKLKTELCYIALNHVEELKKARSLAADSGEGAEVEKYDGEIRDLHKRLNEDILMGGVDLECLPPKHTCTNEFIQALREPKFRVLESEYRISERLLLAEKDWKLTIELLRLTTLTLKILTLGSPEQRSIYMSAWADVASLCARELRHGASIWKQALEKDICEEILSKPQGKSYILALGEVYRVTKILGASATLYKPWILVASTSNPLALVNDCDGLWSSSGLEEALLNISNPSDLHCDESAAMLLESIKFVSELDAFTLYSRIFSAREPACHISGLTAEIIPGMTSVEWNGETYFLTIANLWANLISPDPPCLPHILLG